MPTREQELEVIKAAIDYVRAVDFFLSKEKQKTKLLQKAANFAREGNMAEANRIKLQVDHGCVIGGFEKESKALEKAVRPFIKKIPKLSRNKQYICGYCAETLGGEWPPGHCATAHRGICEYCKEDRSLVNIGDYNWPNHNFSDLRD